MPTLRPQPAAMRGQVVFFDHESQLLKDNPLGDPSRRRHPVYLPPGHDQAGSRRYPVLWCLAAYTNSGPGQVGWRNHGETLPEGLDGLIGTGAMPPAIVVFPVCYPSLGGTSTVKRPAR